MDLTGMGDSDYRYNYASATYAKEIKAVIEHAGFGPNAMVVAHSFGGYMA
ncbi:MAG TPA: alpha/beta hydrolase, partial [Gammaproteobacteria bacterium]|nr:alpha/beta hydrolase [Gammaproteobacteria bacterium]